MTTYKGKEYKDASPFLAPAKTAVAYVSKKMDIGASNKIGPGMIARMLCAGGTFNKGELRTKVEAELKTVKNPTWRDQLEISASWAKLYGCGNCGEQSALAFVYLRQQGIHPLDWMSINNFRHAFVVIGREGASDPTEWGDAWGQRSVLCDPWAGRAEPACALLWVYPNKKMQLLYREE